MMATNDEYGDDNDNYDNEKDTTTIIIMMTVMTLALSFTEW